MCEDVSMKKLSRSKIIWLIAIISTLIIVLFEGVMGVGIGLFPLGSGGEVDMKLTLGGFVHETYYPLTSSDDPYRGPSSELFFEPVLFTVMFFVRMLIIIPLVHLFVSPEESHSHYSPEHSEEQGSSTVGRLSGFLKYFVILYIVIGIVLSAILVYETIGFSEAIKTTSSTSSRIIKQLTRERNMLLVFMIFDLIFTLHHFITSGLILKKKHTFLLFYKTSYVLAFLITIATVVLLFSGGVRYLPYSFFKWHTLIYALDLILFMVNLSYLKDSYEVFQYMNNDDSYTKLKLFK